MTPSPRGPSLKVALVVGQAAIWGVTYVLITIALHGLSAASLAWLRATGGLLVIAALRPRSTRLALGHLRRHAGTALMLAALNLALPFWLVAAGEHTVSSSVTSVLIATGPAMAAIAARWVDASERVGLGGWAGFALATLGVGVVVGFSPSQVGSWAGVLAIVAAAAAYALGALLAKRNRVDWDPWAQTVVTLLGGVAFLTVPALLSPPSRWPSADVITAVTVLAVVGTAVSFLLTFVSVRVGGASFALTPIYLTPAFSIVAAAILLGDPVTTGVAFGSGLTIAGIIVATRSQAIARTIEDLHPAPSGEGVAEGP